MLLARPSRVRKAGSNCNVRRSFHSLMLSLSVSEVEPLYLHCKKNGSNPGSGVVAVMPFSKPNTTRSLIPPHLVLLLKPHVTGFPE